MDAAWSTHCHIGFERSFSVSLIEVVMPFASARKRRRGDAVARKVRKNVIAQIWINLFFWETRERKNSNDLKTFRESKRE
jgi:hypothetical protein